MIAVALNFLDMFLKPKNTPFPWVCALGILLMLLGAGFGLYFGFERLAPSLGYFEAGMLFSGALVFLGGILMLATRPKKQTPVFNKALDTIKEKADDFHLKEVFANNKEAILAASVIAGVLLSFLPHIRKGSSSK